MPSSGTVDVQRELERQYETTFGPGGIAEGKKPWYLHLLCVHPKWQGHGIGRKMLEWGFNKAREDEAPIYLESSPMAYQLYLAKGFRETCRIPSIAPNGYSIEFPGMIWF